MESDCLSSVESSRLRTTACVITISRSAVARSGPSPSRTLRARDNVADPLAFHGSVAGQREPSTLKRNLGSKGQTRPALTPVRLPTFVRVWGKLLIARPGAPGTILTPRLLRRALTARAGRAWSSTPALANTPTRSIWSRLLAARCRASGRVFASRFLWESLLCRSCQRPREEDCGRYQRNSAKHLSSSSVPHSSVPQFIFRCLSVPQVIFRCLDNRSRRFAFRAASSDGSTAHTMNRVCSKGSARQR
jgi:hypothetical protein